jgi:hypothetical protein
VYDQYQRCKNGYTLHRLISFSTVIVGRAPSDALVVSCSQATASMPHVLVVSIIENR